MSTQSTGLILAIEISNPPPAGTDEWPAVALARRTGEGVEVIAARGLARAADSPAARPVHNDGLMPAIAELFAEAGLRPCELGCQAVGSGVGGRVAVSIGPGGYTAVRIACAAGKAIADAVGAPCVAVPSCVVAARAARDGAGAERHVAAGAIAVALAVKNQTAWVWVETPDAGSVAGARVMGAEEVGGLRERGVRVLLADEHLPGAMREACAAAGIAVAERRLDAVACARASVGFADVDPAGLNPLYPREPDAVTQWRARGAAASGR